MFIYKYIVRFYFSIKNYWPLWFNVLNKKGRDLFEENKPEVDEVSKKVIDELRNNGIATTSLDALFPGQNLLKKLTDYTNTLHPESAEQGSKSFLKKYWDKHPVFNLANPFLALTLNKKVLAIANSYMGMWTRLIYYDLAMTLPVGENAEARESQRWHRDPEEKRMCKMFIYLTDVDESAGPFTYVEKSVYGMKYGNLFKQKTPGGIYPDKEKVEKAIDKKDIKVMTAKAGTVIFCDTSGIHKGGYATTKPRFMSTSFFSSGTYSEKKYYSIPEKTDLSSLSKEALYAINK